MNYRFSLLAVRREAMSPFFNALAQTSQEESGTELALVTYLTISLREF